MVSADDDEREDEDWPRLPAAPRRVAHPEAIVALAGDGNRQFAVAVPFFFLGAVVFMFLIDALQLPEFLILIGPMLGAWFGSRLNRKTLVRVFESGIETHGEIVERIDPGAKKRPRFVYRYFVDGKESRHDATNQNIETLEVGMPVLVIHDRQRIGRHVAFFPPRVPELRQLLGPDQNTRRPPDRST